MSEKETFVHVEGSDVFFYCDVSDETVAELNASLKKVETELFSDLIRNGLYDVTPTIRLHIRSDGGELYSGLAAMDFIQSMRASVTTIAEGCCASAATFLFLAGDTRIVRQNAYILIHQIGSDLWGRFEQLKDEMRQCERLMEHIKKIYLRETNLSEKKLRRCMRHDVYLSHSKCVKYGITRP